MEELLAESSFENLKEGAIVTGTITEIRDSEVVIDIGAKAEGEISASEFIDVGELQIGAEIEVFLEKLEDRDGNPILSYDKAEQKKNWENMNIAKVSAHIDHFHIMRCSGAARTEGSASSAVCRSHPLHPAA